MQTKSNIDLVNQFVNQFIYSSIYGHTFMDLGHAVSPLVRQVTPGRFSQVCVPIQPFVSCEEAVMDLLRWQHLIGCSCSKTHSLSMSNCQLCAFFSSCSSPLWTLLGIFLMCFRVPRLKTTSGLLAGRAFKMRLTLEEYIRLSIAKLTGLSCGLLQIAHFSPLHPSSCPIHTHPSASKLLLKVPL